MGVAGLSGAIQICAVQKAITTGVPAKAVLLIDLAVRSADILKSYMNEKFCGKLGVDMYYLGLSEIEALDVETMLVSQCFETFGQFWLYLIICGWPLPRRHRQSGAKSTSSTLSRRSSWQKNGMCPSISNSKRRGSSSASKASTLGLAMVTEGQAE